ncbi:hypothetical protein [Photobacterium sp. GB-36]|uniref:hypothetical protein n=1 Tax=Photobacterium sp. GB-36 TaxID=2022108 RepID=UPI001E48E91B|nr:hypothetical protein [Photobacterium sp. GB-36]
MFSDILATSLEEFAHDCMLLCEQHYPTIHSRGMQEDHLAKTLCRRIAANCAQQNTPVKITHTDQSQHASQAIYCLQHEQSYIWVIAHHFISANKARRDALLSTIEQVQRNFSTHGEHYLMVIADHWFDRSKASKEIPAWWLGELPDNHLEYAATGIKLQPSESSFAESVKQRFHLTNGSMSLKHPFVRHDNQSPVLRYLFLTAIYKID